MGLQEAWPVALDFFSTPQTFCKGTGSRNMTEWSLARQYQCGREQVRRRRILVERRPPAAGRRARRAYAGPGPSAGGPCRLRSAQSPARPSRVCPSPHLRRSGALARGLQARHVGWGASARRQAVAGAEGLASALACRSCGCRCVAQRRLQSVAVRWWQEDLFPREHAAAVTGH